MIETTDEMGVSIDPKYLGDTSYGWGIVHLGPELLCLAGVIDISQADHELLVAQPDVRGLPADLDENLTAGAITAISNFLEARNVPAGWLSTSRTYRQTLRVLTGIFLFVQRWNGIGRESGEARKSPFTEGLNLETRYNQLPAPAQQKLLKCFDSLQVDRTMLTANSTIREALFEFGKQMALRPCIIGEQI